MELKYKVGDKVVVTKGKYKDQIATITNVVNIPSDNIPYSTSLAENYWFGESSIKKYEPPNINTQLKTLYKTATLENGLSLTSIPGGLLANNGTSLLFIPQQVELI